MFWACVGCIAATLILGFTWGGWVTGGAAEEMVEEAADQARTEVAAAVCVEKFMGADDARVHLTSLKEIGPSWEREDFIEKGDWAMVADQEYDDAAELCAERLMEMELPPAQKAATSESGTVTQ